MKRVLILQPYLPAYRAEFFTLLAQTLAVRDVEMRVIVGTPQGDQAKRGDALTDKPWLARVPFHSLSFAGRAVTWRRFAPSLLAEADLIVAEYAISSIDSWRIAVDRNLSRKLVLWGHVKSYVTSEPPLGRWAKSWLGRRAVGILAYTEGGGRYAQELGIDRSRVTVLNNTLSVDARERVVAKDRRSFLFIGGLDRSKRLDRAVEVADLVARHRPGFQLLVAGEGALKPWLDEQAASRPHLKMLGRLDGPEKVRIASGCLGMLVTGRVGLVAIDSFALGLPMVTPAWAFHAPEFEYLEHGTNALITGDSIAEMAAAIERMMDEPELAERLAQGCREAAGRYTVPKMVNNFVAGLEKTGRI